MSENPIKPAEKKRSVYKPGSLLDFPEQILDRKKYSYRWINAELLAAASDGYEPRGWALFTDASGKNIRRGDLVLGQMPIDIYRSMMEAEDEQRQVLLKTVLEKQTAQEEQLTHEFKKSGGRTKFTFTQE